MIGPAPVTQSVASSAADGQDQFPADAVAGHPPAKGSPPTPAPG